MLPAVLPLVKSYDEKYLREITCPKWPFSTRLVENFLPAHDYIIWKSSFNLHGIISLNAWGHGVNSYIYWYHTYACKLETILLRTVTFSWFFISSLHTHIKCAQFFLSNFASVAIWGNFDTPKLEANIFGRKRFDSKATGKEI